jgi:hypothetical protein
MIKGKEFLQRSLKDKTEGKRPLGKLKHRWKDNIKTDFEKEDGEYELESYSSGEGSVVGSCTRGINKHSGSIKCWELPVYVQLLASQRFRSAVS